VLRQVRRSLLIAGVALAIVILLLAGVDGPAQHQQVPASGGVYVEGVVGHPTYLNPLLSPFNDADGDVVSLVFNGLTRVSANGAVAPDLADHWTISPDGKTYTFHLRDAVWQDGQPVTADDVVFTIHQIQAPGFPGSPEIAKLWQPIKVSKIDSRTVQFQLSAPYAPFLEYTTQGILPAHLLNGVTGRQMLSNPFNAHPIGTGPFMVKSASIQEITLEPNPHYYDKQPYLAGITFRYYDSYQTALDALRRGDIQGLGNVPSDSALSLANDSRLTILQKPEFAKLSLMVLNTQSPIFSNDVVRRALDLALNRTQIIQAAINGEGVPAAGPIMPDSWAYVAQPNAYIYAPDQAAKLLDQAGWTLPAPGALREKNGKPFRFVLLAANEPDRLRTAQEISRELRAVGIEADVQTAGWSGIVQDFLAPHRFDAVLTELYSPTADPDPYPFWDSSQIKSGLNVAGWSNRVADQLLEDGRANQSRDARQQDYAKFQSLFAQEQPSILLYYPVYVYALPSALHGTSLGLMLQPSDRFQTVTDWYLRTQNATTP